MVRFNIHTTTKAPGLEEPTVGPRIGRAMATTGGDISAPLDVLGVDRWRAVAEGVRFLLANPAAMSVDLDCGLRVARRDRRRQ